MENDLIKENENENEIINLKEVNDDNSLEEENYDKIDDDMNKNNNNFKDNKEKQKLKYTELFDLIKSNNKSKSSQINEFYCNILLMPLEINISNKISTLSLITDCYKENNKYQLINNIARKFGNYFELLKAIDPSFFVHVFYQASKSLEEQNNIIYSFKYSSLSRNIVRIYKQMDMKKIHLVVNFYNDIVKKLKEYTEKTKKIFIKDNSFTSDKCSEIKNLINLVLEGKNQLDNNDNFLYIINKTWLVKLKNFLEDYLLCIEDENKTIFLKSAFDTQSFLEYYLKNELNIDNNNKNSGTKNNDNKIQDKKNSNKNKTDNKKENINDKKNNKKDNNKNDIEIKENIKYSIFPGPINNYCITDFKDAWFDNINIDENYFLRKDIKLNIDYCLINQNDWNILNSCFGSTNEILRKKNNLELIKLKFILLDKKINKKNNNIDLLKIKYIQINKNSYIKHLKEKIINISNNILNMNKEENIIIEKNNKEIEFYTLDKDNKDLLIEICFAFYINNQKYDSLYINKLNISDGAMIDDFLSEVNKDKKILIVEVIEKEEQNFLEDLKIKMEKEYKCIICNKDLYHINDKYNCNLCNFSLFCSKNCSDKSIEHINLDEKLAQIYEPKFNLQDLLSLKLESLLIDKTRKGRVGLSNLGNTCYLNSSLQCLSNTEDFTKYFLNGDYSKEINNANSSGSRGAISKSYYDLINKMWKETDFIINPYEFRETFCQKEEYFFNNEQHDSQEFLFALLNDLHDELNRVTNKKYMELKEKQKNETDEQASDRYWNYHKSRENSIIVDLFQGQYKSKIICLSCKNESVTFDTYMNLQLPIPSKKMQNQIKFLLSSGECIMLSLKLDENTEIKDVIQKALSYINNKKYLDYLTSEKIKDNIYNYNNTEIPKYLLYNNIIIAEFSSDLSITNIYKTSYENSKIVNEYEIINLENIIDEENNLNDINNIKNENKIKNKRFSFYFNKNIKNANNDNKLPIDREKLINIYERNKNREIVLFEKNLNSIDANNVDIFVYPITLVINKGVLGSITDIIKLTYPIIVTLNKNNTIKELQSSIHQKISKILKISEQNNPKSILMCFPHFLDNWKNFKISSKKCPICGDIYNNIIKYCLIIKHFNYNSKIEDLINRNGIDRPLILFAGSKYFNPKFQLYKGINLLSSEIKKETEIQNDLTIYDSLELFHKEEILDREEKWFCSNCNKLQKAIKKMEIYKTPLYLIVQLKRFKQRGAIMGSILGVKNETFIDYKEILNLNDFVSGPDKRNSIYLLYGVIIHKKLLNGGHYISLCKNNGEWLIYNDTQVGYCGNPINKDAYLLFYKRKTDD